MEDELYKGDVLMFILFDSGYNCSDTMIIGEELQPYIEVLIRVPSTDGEAQQFEALIDPFIDELDGEERVRLKERAKQIMGNTEPYDEKPLSGNELNKLFNAEPAMCAAYDKWTEYLGSNSSPSASGLKRLKLSCDWQMYENWRIEAINDLCSYLEANVQNNSEADLAATWKNEVLDGKRIVKPYEPNMLYNITPNTWGLCGFLNRVENNAK